jgi:hypothetical protein
VFSREGERTFFVLELSACSDGSGPVKSVFA